MVTRLFPINFSWILNRIDLLFIVFTCLQINIKFPSVALAKPQQRLLYLILWDSMILQVNKSNSTECLVHLFGDHLYHVIQRWRKCFVFYAHGGEIYHRYPWNGLHYSENDQDRKQRDAKIHIVFCLWCNVSRYICIPKGGIVGKITQQICTGFAQSNTKWESIKVNVEYKVSIGNILMACFALVSVKNVFNLGSLIFYPSIPTACHICINPWKKKML